jgi:hypothetical protein
MDIVPLFYDLDKFAVGFEPLLRSRLLSDGRRHRDRPGRMHLGEVMTILVLFHDSNDRTFKHFYLRHVGAHLRAEFPRLVSYGRFVEHVPDALPALAAFLRTRLAACTGVSFVDSTPLRVCHNARINAHRVMKGLAARGKTSTGWFYGSKLHLVVSDRGGAAGPALHPRQRRRPQARRRPGCRPVRPARRGQGVHQPGPVRPAVRPRPAADHPHQDEHAELPDAAVRTSCCSASGRSSRRSSTG